MEKIADSNSDLKNTSSAVVILFSLLEFTTNRIFWVS